MSDNATYRPANARGSRFIAEMIDISSDGVALIVWTESAQVAGGQNALIIGAGLYASDIAAIFGGQANYAQKMIDELKTAGVNPMDTWVQSFNKDDILYWIQNEPAFGKQAVIWMIVDRGIPINFPLLH